MSRWIIISTLTCLIAAVTASDNKETPKEITNSSERVRRQFQSWGPSSLDDDSFHPFAQDDFVEYDPSGLGFEIKKPPLFFDVIDEQSGAFKPAPHVSTKPPSYPESKQNYYSPYAEPHRPTLSSSNDPIRKTIYPNNYATISQPEWKPVSIPETYPKRQPAYPTVPHKLSETYSPYCPKMAGYESKCRHAKDCAIWYDLVLTLPGAACKLSNGYPGICCPDIPYNGRSTGSLKQETKKIVKLERQCIDIYSVNAAAHAGEFQLKLMEETERLLRTNNVTVRPRSSTYNHLQLFQTTTEAQRLSRGALIAIETTMELGKRFKLTPDQTAFGLSQFKLRDTILSNTCPADPICDRKTLRSPFRTIDGSCNNIKNPSWGKSMTQFERATVPAYADGVWQPRVSQRGGQLPSPRLVSISVVLDKDSPSQVNTHWVMQYGQFVVHDLAFTTLFRSQANTDIQCCTDGGKFLPNPELFHPQCLPIEIPIDDPFYTKFGQRCMNFVRSSPAPRSDCSLGPAEQMNGNTHFLDLSNVYGSDVNTAESLRTFEKGHLKVTRRRGHHELDLLPADNATQLNCALSKAVSGIPPPPEVRCFKAGDIRPNQTPNLGATQTIFLREHNRLAAELSHLNPHWDDERLYQEARRILIAQMQHIAYNEWLPVIVGREKMQELGLLPLQHGFSNDYDANVNPGILNEFSAASCRFGHSLIQGKQDLTNLRRKKESRILLRQHFLKTQTLYTPGNLDKFLTGLAAQPSQDFDNYFTEEVTNHLFEEEGKGFGLDLVSLNIQRGRDRGIPGYNTLRALCGLRRATNFKDLLDVISPAIVERFELLYDTVDDIDLFIGGISESKVEGASVGPTFQCMVADQFLRLKRGDRYFYDLGGQSGSFTEEQLYEIRQTSFARLICDNSHVQHTQPLVFKLESAQNPVVSCESSSIPRVNLLAWQEGLRKPYDTPYKKISY
ncbi:peroxidase-like [Daphnia carinata]|uniref:peroxidase-like n=1 Tax=Daphnia carinata TaxID=120202 RepID=UPI00257ED725|nr:peroxidase-like [Daphnia carinata]